ncbi:class I SAM-dependent methyltransferase [Candidatus Saccharibacteria bacterium]|nr:class I SAM-dependent methyltransferase [Candidatus Saccharibacteria bacterium]
MSVSDDHNNATAASSSDYWERHWQDVDKLPSSLSDHPVHLWIREKILTVEDGRCMEIGCYPGQFLTILGDMGYILNGVDYFEGSKDFLTKQLKQNDYKIGEIFEQDFQDFESQELYDLTCSFGFVEHFHNYKEMIEKQVAMTKDGGQIIVEVPNLASPLYKMLYKILEPETLNNHVFEAMNLDNLTETLANSGAENINGEYIGHFFFRFVSKRGRTAKLVERTINKFQSLLDLLPQKISARYMGVVATKGCNGA